MQTIHSINPIIGFSLLSFALLTFAVICFRRGVHLDRRSFGSVALAIMSIFGLFGSGWCASSAVSARLAPDYLIRNIRNEKFEKIVESVASDAIDTSETNKGRLEAYYFSDQPILVTLEGFKGILFLPPRPEAMGVAGVLPLHQLVLPDPPKFRAHAIVAANIKFMAGRRKLPPGSTQRNPPVE